jgi:hypothetical protein
LRFTLVERRQTTSNKRETGEAEGCHGTIITIRNSVISRTA